MTNWVWKASVVAALFSLLMVIAQIWFNPFPHDFYEKLVATWTAFVITAFVLKFLESVLNKKP